MHKTAVIEELRKAGLPTHRRPTLPGEILRREYLDVLGLSVTQLAEALEVPPDRLRHLLQGAISLNAELAVRLSKVLKGSPTFWLGLQQQVDLYEAIVSCGGKPLPVLNPDVPMIIEV